MFMCYCHMFYVICFSLEDESLICKTEADEGIKRHMAHITLLSYDFL